MLKCIHVIFTCLAAITFCRAQNLLPDSIEKRFSGIRQDSNYVLKLNSLATDYLKTNPAASRSIASYVIDLSPKLKFTRGYARGLTVMGNSYWYEGIYEFAQNYYLLAARQYQSIHDSVGLAQVYNNIGEVNKRLGEYDAALEYLTLSLGLKKMDTTRAITLYNIGELYVTAGNYSMAQEFIGESLNLARAQNDERVIAYDFWSIARIKSAQGAEREALTNFKLAEERWIKLGETRSLIQTYQDMARLYLSNGRLNDAQEYLDKATELSTQIQVPDLRIMTFLELSKLDSMRGNFQGAYYYLTRHNTLKDSVYNLLKAEQIARVQTIYETEMHERENRELRIEKALKETKIASQNVLIIVVSVGLVIAAILLWILIRQRKKILASNKDLKAKNDEINLQKEAIEQQASALLKLNGTLQELNKSLEGRIDERSRQLLLQNKKLAEYTFINAHKLRGPVASILGLITLIQYTNPQEHAAIITYLKTCGDQLDVIIREIGNNLESAMISENH